MTHSTDKPSVKSSDALKAAKDRLVAADAQEFLDHALRQREKGFCAFVGSADLARLERAVAALREAAA